jgi:iron complex outermembrane receptor protein
VPAPRAVRLAPRPVTRAPAVARTTPTLAPGITAPAVQPGLGPVRGYVATSSVTATKTDTPILETPQSVSVVTKDQMTAQGVQTISEALRYTPGVFLNNYGVNSVFDTITVRGFQVPYFLDGLRLPVDAATTFVTPRIVPFGLERLEVLRGPSSGLYGQTPPGGLVNAVSKRPTDTPQNEVDLQTGSFNRLQGMLDFSGPLDASREWLYRVVGLVRQSGTQIDFQEDNQYYLAPSLTWRPDNNTSFTILSTVQRYSGKGYQQWVPGIGSLWPNPNGRIAYSTYLGEPDQDYFRLNRADIGYAFEHRFNDVLQFRQNVRYTTIDFNMLAMRSEGLVAGSFTDARRNELNVKGHTSNVALDNQLQADFATGPARHKVLLGLDYYRTRSDSGYNGAAGTPINIFDPVYGMPQPPVYALSTFLDAVGDLRQIGLYAQDQIKLERWILTLSGRADQANNTVINKPTAFTPGATTQQQRDTAQTGRAGLSYVFDSGVAPYIAYATSFEPTPGVDAQGNAFKPTTGKSSEVGIKYQPVGINALFTAAFFDITQQNVLTTNPANVSFSIQTGEVRVKGFEFEARVSLTDRFDLVGGYSRLDPRVTQTNTVGGVGKYMTSVALETASLWGMYTMRDGPMAGWGFGAGVRHIGRNYADALNTIDVPPYELFDAALTYDFGYLRHDLKGLKFQLNATNLANKYYVVNCSGINYCALGAGRTILATLKYQWPVADAKDNRILK